MKRAWLGILVLAVEAEALDAEVCGAAERLDDGRHAYREWHFPIERGRRIEYRDAAGELIATNELSWSGRPAAPEHRQHDLRRSVQIGASWQDGRLLLSRGNESKLVSAREPTVISAGFDHFVRDNWQVLLDGKRLEFDFPLPQRLRTVRLAIRRVTPQQSEIEAPRDDWVLMRIGAASRFLDFFVEPIDLAYDPQRRLRRYRGLSNISAPEGGGLAVAISYYYSDEARASGACS